MKKELVLLLLFITLPGLAQINYQPGYFISNNGAKTECLIRNVAWKDAPVEFDYKANDGAETQKGQIKNVSEFSVDNSYKFIRFDILVDLSPNDINFMSINKEPEWIKETAFLKVLVQGDATLYEYTRGNIVRFFYTANEVTEQLVYKPYKVGTSIGYNNKFRGQLFEVMKSKISDRKRFENMRYEKNVLIKLFLEYNGMTLEEAGNFSSKQNKTDFNLKVTAGANLAKVTLEQETFDEIHTFNFDRKAIFSVGLEAELVFPFNNKKWSFFANPNYQSYNNTTTVKDNVLTQHWTIEYSFIEIPIGIRHYMYLGDKSKLFINAGYNVVFGMKDNNISYHYDGPNSIEYVRNAKASKSSNVALGAGYSYDRYSIELRYNFKRDIIGNKVYWYSEYSSIGMIITYKLF
ncbi:outer membrane beta-barrel protein [Flavobacterium sp. DGU11]|uniref:Outer membrane beta-barrel protein n=1 Tax=Flavobacterium arundinis TaxID=3139143 RepID=A0ABU9HVC2_9FLAO